MENEAAVMKKERSGKMELTFWQIAGIILGFLVIFGTGFFISTTGRPFNTGIFTIHKLIAVAAVVVLSVLAFRTGRASGLTGIELTGVVATGVLFLGTLVTGGMLSVKEMPAVVSRLHLVLPFVTTLFTGVTMFLLR